MGGRAAHFALSFIYDFEIMRLPGAILKLGITHGFAVECEPIPKAGALSYSASSVSF